ncbi:MAG: hypothetical protein NZ853_02330 [Leptospiraceae bacterium]|nr:hypothetical protein [Leptospiraceae bacterium]MDW7975016.1 hypothetical protein [Leptospiraceae bacterium]
MLRWILYIVIAYLVYRVIRYLLKPKEKKYYYVVDEKEGLRKERDITSEVKVIEEKRGTSNTN